MLTSQEKTNENTQGFTYSSFALKRLVRMNMLEAVLPVKKVINCFIAFVNIQGSLIITLPLIWTPAYSKACNLGNKNWEKL